MAVNHPCGVTFGDGEVYVTEAGGDLVRRLDPGTGILGTVVGGEATGATSSAPDVALNGPCGIVADTAGNLVFADTGNGVVRVEAARNGTFYGVAMRAGHVYIVAGGGLAHGTPATRAGLLNPAAVAVDRHGNLLVSSAATYLLTATVTGPASALVQVVGGATGTFYGQRMVPGGLYTIAGNPCGGTTSTGCPPGFAGDGGPAAMALFGTVIPQMAVDASGDVLLADSDNSRVRVIAASSRTVYGQQMRAGHIYTIAGGGTGGLGDGGAATSATLGSPQGVALAANGNVVVSDAGDLRIWLVAASSGWFYGRAMTRGDIYIIAGHGAFGFAGDNGPAVRAKFRYPSGAAVDRDGNVLIADSGNNRVRLVAARTGTFYRKRMTAGDIYTVAGDGYQSYSGDRGLATLAQLLQPNDVTVSHVGNIIESDTGNNMVRVVAETDGVFYGQKFTAGHIYRVAGTGAPGGFSGDGGPATAARFWYPAAAVTDAAGNILVADRENNRVRVIAVKSGRFYGRPMTAGYVYTVAGGGTSRADGIPVTEAEIFPWGLAVDHSGNIVLNDGIVSLRVVAEKSGWFYGQRMTAGDIYTVAGSPYIAGIAVDGAGNLVVTGYSSSDVEVYAVRSGRFYGRPMIAGHFYAVAGASGKAGFSGDGGPATKAMLNGPAAVAVDSAGNLLVADTGNRRVRVVAERTGSFYGKKMTAGDIYTVAGGGKGGLGDGGPATHAFLFGPVGVAPFGTGLVLLDGDRMRAVSG